MGKIFFCYLGLIASALSAQNSSEQVFTNIYEKNVWGCGSGGGSKIENVGPYILFLQQFMQEKHISSVVDIGCGDWQFSRSIDWSGIQYKGYDVVKAVIERNQQSYSGPSIEFIHADAIQTELPEADLFICKDVLQHLTNEDIKKLLSQLPKFKYCLITNDVDSKTLSSVNQNIPRGATRPIDITADPFHLEGQKVLRYRAESSIKQVVYVER